jgi:hypothetical protein
MMLVDINLTIEKLDDFVPVTRQLNFSLLFVELIQRILDFFTPVKVLWFDSFVFMSLKQLDKLQYTLGFILADQLFILFVRHQDAIH